MAGAVRRALLLALVACAESAPEELQVPEHETVYECGYGEQILGEWCFDGSADDLSQLVRAPCWESKDERFCVGPPWAPCFPVCLYSCEPGHRGCNALSGCRC